MTPEVLQMISDMTENLAALVTWLILILVILAGIGTVSLGFAFGIGLAIRYAIRYLWRRMAEGQL